MLTSRTFVPRFLVIVCAFVAAGCSRVDDTDLAKVAAFYNDAATSKKARYSLLAAASAPYVDRESYLAPDPEPPPEKPPSAPGNVTSSVLRTDNAQGRTYGLVQVETVLSSCVEVSTQTWIREDGHWRRLLVPLLREKADKLYANGDYKSAIAAYEEWLAIDPFSTHAYSNLLMAFKRSSTMDVGNHRSRADVLRSLLSINDADHVVLFQAASSADDHEIAKAFFRRIPSNACERSNAAFNIALNMNVERPRDVVSFLEPFGLDGRLQLLRIRAFSQLGDRANLISSLAPELLTAIRVHLKENDASYAAYWSSAVAHAAMQARMYDEARSLADFGITRDPSNTSLAFLTRRLSDPRLRDIGVTVSFEPPRAYFGKSVIPLRITNLSGIQLDQVTVVLSSRESDRSKPGETIAVRTVRAIAPGGTGEGRAEFSAKPSAIEGVDAWLVSANVIDGDNVWNAGPGELGFQDVARAVTSAPIPIPPKD